jgi:hypothetical protein
VEDDPATPEDETLKEKGWCFVYGEKDWVDGKAFSKVKQSAADYNADGIKQTPMGRANCS